MRSIFGRINCNKQIINKSLIEESLQKLLVYHNTKKDLFISDKYGFGQIDFTPPDNTKIFESSDYIILSDCRLDNTNDLITELDISNNNINTEEIIIKAYQIWGKNCSEKFLGDFAFAIWDKKNEELFCARDQFGVKSFYYYFDGQSFVFSSEISAILSQTDLSFTIDKQYIADTISIVKSENYRTTYKEIRKLPPANLLSLKNNIVEIREYWKLKKQKTLLLPDNEIIKQFKSLLIESVKCRINNNDTIGTELSGGLDSSTVTAIASQFSNVKTFSHILPDNKLGKIHPFKDERYWINLLTDYCNIAERNFITSESTGIIEAINNKINSFNSLTQQNFSTFSDYLYIKAKEEDISVLLSGFGGDEVVTSKASEYLKELASEKHWDELKTDLRNQGLNNTQYSKTLFKYYLKSRSPFIYNFFVKIKNGKPWWYGKFKNLAINEDYAKTMKIKKRYFSNYENLHFSSTQDRCIERITHTHVSQRLEYCSLTAKKYGIEYRYPLLDKRLIEFYLSIPPRLKAQNGIKRYTIRKAIEGLVPEKIQWRDDKSGATIPTVFMRTLSDKNQIKEIINRAKLNKKVTKYINLEEFEHWFYELSHRSKKTKKNINPGAFYNYLKLIMFIEKHPNLFND